MVDNSLHHIFVARRPYRPSNSVVDHRVGQTRQVLRTSDQLAPIVYDEDLTPLP